MTRFTRRSNWMAWAAPALAFWALLTLVDRSQNFELRQAPPGRPGAVQASAVAPNQLPNAFPDGLRVAYVVEDHDFYCNLGINNLGDSPLTARVSLIDEAGRVLGVRTTRVSARGMVQINRVVSYLRDTPAESTEGHLLLQTDQDSRAWVALIDRESLDSSVMLGSDETARRILIPSSVASERYTSGLVVVNTSAQGTFLRITIRNPQGTTLGMLDGLSVVAQGSVYLKDVFKAAGIATVGTPVFGPIEVEAPNGAQLQASLLIRTTERTGGFLPGMNLDRGARTLLLPYVEDSSEARTNLGLNNPGSVQANVSVSLTTPEGRASAAHPISLPPNSLTQLDSVVQQLGGGISRSGWLRVTSDQDVFAWASRIDQRTQDPALFVATSQAATKWLIPSATSAGNFRSSLAVANLEAQPCGVRLTVRGSDGSVMKSIVVTLPGSGMFVSQDVLAVLGLAGRFGPIEVESLDAKPLLATSLVTSSQGAGSDVGAVPLEPLRKVLYLTHSAGFQHGVLPLSENVLREMGAVSRAFEVEVASDSRTIQRDNLRSYDAVVFYTSGELPLSEDQKQALLDFVRSGKGFTGIHSATDTLYNWPEYGELIGGYFDGHPWHQEVVIETEDPVHAATRHLAPGFRLTDEIYQFRSFIREQVHGLLRLDNGSVNLNVPGVNRSDGDFALAWTRTYGSGRVFYTALGHREEVWQDKRFQRHLLNGIRWTLRDVR